MTTVTVTTQSQILRHTAAFTSSVLLQSELQRRLIATLLRDTLISDQKHLKLVADTVESAHILLQPRPTHLLTLSLSRGEAPLPSPRLRNI